MVILLEGLSLPMMGCFKGWDQAEMPRGDRVQLEPYYTNTKRYRVITLFRADTRIDRIG